MSGASKRASGGVNGPVLSASISYLFYPPCAGSNVVENREKMEAKGQSPVERKRGRNEKGSSAFSIIDESETHDDERGDEQQNAID